MAGTEVTFGEIDKALKLVKERPDAAWVLYKLDGGIDHVLVDEAQDTNPDQWEVIRRLTEEFFVGEGAVDRHGGIPPYAETREYVRRIQAIYALTEHPFDPAITAPSPLLQSPAASR